MARSLKKLKIFEVSGVDNGAGRGCRIVLLKRDGAHAMGGSMDDAVSIAKRVNSRIEELMAADPEVRSYASAVAKIATSRDPADQALWREYKQLSFVAEAPEPAPIEKSDALLKLEKKARKLAKRQGLSEAVAFAKVYADPANAELVGANKNAHFAKVNAPQFMPQVTDPMEIRPAERTGDTPNLEALRGIARAIQAEYPNRRYSDREALAIAALTPKGQQLLRGHRSGELRRLIGYSP